MRDYILVTQEGAKTCTANDKHLDEIGLKAKGQLALPSAWVPRFIVISPDLFDEFRAAADGDGGAVVSRWCASIADGLDLAGVDRITKLIIRSNALAETLRDRGRLASATAEFDSLAHDLTELLVAMVDRADQERIGLIIQVFIEPIVRGHLSNERRVKEERRDGLIQFEDIPSGAITEDSIAHRNWRRRSPPSEQLLICPRMPDIKDVLREPLAYAAVSKERIHFEWVWNGSAVYVVQADPEHEAESGVRPEALVGKPTVEPSIEELSVFSRAVDSDRTKASKLDNHFRFQDAGFWQPTFYLLEDPQVLEDLANGKVSQELWDDLGILTKSLFVIRTSCKNQHVQLLPRSHILSSAEEAVNWLKGEFSSDIRKISVDPRKVMLIAHHYVQALSSAFSMGSADKQEVRIEASWGIPEGLYYNPCDTYIVNTLSRDVDSLGDDYARFTLRTPSRGPKRHFVAPNPSNGQFERHKVTKPFDWKPTVGDQDTLNLIAAFTRQLADEKGHPINLMWFVDCRTADGEQKAIPWYCEKLEEQYIQKYRQNTKDKVFEVSTESDLDALERGDIGYDRSTQGRLVVELNPTENVALRDSKFAERVGAAVVQQDGLIILNGATLSHIYYVLQRSGAMVCSRRDTEIEADRESHLKLVRDKIPYVVESSGETAVINTLTREEKQAALRIKLLEEAFEVKDASEAELIGELADVMEVVRALGRSFGLSLDQIEEERRKKEETRGSFDEGIVLVETLSSPPSARISPDSPQQDLELKGERTDVSKSAVDLGAVGHGWRDIRQDRDFSEIIESASVPIWHREWSINSARGYQLPADLKDARLTWELLGKRDGPLLKLKIRIQIGDQQLTLNLPSID